MSRIGIVTGGAQGIGAATVRRLAESGMHVFVADIAAEPAADLCESIRVAGGVATFVESDLFAAGGSESSVERIMAHTGGKLDVLVNNAFAYERAGHMTDVTADALGADLDRLLISYHSMIRAAHPALARSDTAAVVNLASVRGFYTGVGFGPYSIAKAAIAQLTRVYAHELGTGGIRVNAVAPGVIGTARTMAQPQRNRDLVASYTPLGRIGQPDDVAQAIAFLASPAAGFITGQVLSIDGGLTLPLHTDSVNIGVSFEASSDG